MPLNYHTHIQQAIDMIEGRLGDILTLAECAAASGYSQYHFVRIFAMTTGMTPMDYVRRRRLTEAVALIARGVSAQAAANLTGFGSPEHFSRLFRAEHGITLREYKKRLPALCLQPPLSLAGSESGPPALHPQIVMLAPLSLLGFHFDSYRDPEQTMVRAWNMYHANRLAQYLLDESIKDASSYGVPLGSGGGAEDFFIGVQAHISSRPQDAKPLTLPAGIYARFTTPQADAATFIKAEEETWRFAYEHWLPNTGLAHTGPSFVMYSESENRYQRSLFIPIKEETHMKRIDLTLTAPPKETTGFLHTFASSLLGVLSVAPFATDPDDSVATTGFAFRIWIDAKEFCPSAMSIWNYGLMPKGVRNAGYACTYDSRLWGETAVELERRQQAHAHIKASIDRGIPAIAWDLGVAEWGLIVGYDDTRMQYAYIDVTGEGMLDYDKLGQREIPILSVLTVTDKIPVDKTEQLESTLRIAASHARGGEPCDNASGLAAYDALLDLCQQDVQENDWSWQYTLGTFCDLRYFAWQYLQKAAAADPSLAAAAGRYHDVYAAWRQAYDAHASKLTSAEKREAIHGQMKKAAAAERSGIEAIEAWLSAQATRE